jgi:hypothetical protein
MFRVFSSRTYHQLRRDETGATSQSKAIIYFSEIPNQSVMQITYIIRKHVLTIWSEHNYIFYTE